MQTDDEQLLTRFLEAVTESPLSPETISEAIGGNPSGPTIRRYQRGDLPKKRLDVETRRGIELFLTSHAGHKDAKPGDLPRRLDAVAAAPLDEWAKAWKIAEISAAYRAAAIYEAEVGSRIRAEAMKEAEQASKARSGAMEREAADRAATRDLRVMALTSELLGDGEELSDEEIAMILEKRRQRGQRRAAAG